MDGLVKALAEAKDAAAVLQSLVTVAAFLFGGAWAYFKFVKGRVFTTRLEPVIEGRIVSYGARSVAVLRVSIRNVGLSKVNIDGDESTIEVLGFPADSYVAEFHSSYDTKFGVIRALTTHSWIEPGELIVEDRIVTLPPTELFALKVHLRILQSHRSSWRRRARVEWDAVAILTPDTRPEPRGGCREGDHR
jgi:hypothetical protein